VRPAALLLDFGGVLADAPKGRTPPPEVVLRIYNLTGGVLTPGEIQLRLIEADAAYGRWRDEDQPDELSQAEVWERFVLGGWPSSAQVRVRTAVKRLSYDWAWRHNWALRPGIPEMLAAAASRGIPLAVVSNTLCGAAHRDFLAKAGVGGFFKVQVYSDEAGVRKPNPQMIWLAAAELDVAPGECWFVGDSRRRDVQCARRAEVAKAILMRSPRTDREDPAPWPAPDVTVDDGFGVIELIS
jgi:N-acetyl-D-muramate 6-phosphate phosphatase